jgi:hypothetical protein
MNNYSNASLNHNMELLNALSVELNDIMIINELTLQKLADLYAQIAACEARQEFFNASLTESEKIAEEITRNAARRVINIIARAQNIIGTQREQIACIEEEIVKLNREMKQDCFIELKPQPQTTDRSSICSDYILRDPQNIVIGEGSLSVSQTDISTSPLQPVVCREFSLQEPQELDNPIEQAEIIEIDQNESLMHLDTFVDAHHYETIDAYNEQIDNLCENQTPIKRLQTSNAEFDDVLPGNDMLQFLRETLSARELDKPDISFKEKLGQIFRTRN